VSPSYRLQLARTLPLGFVGCQEETEGFMTHKLLVSIMIAALVCGYGAMLYAVMRIVVLIDHSYFQSLAM
jgi:hypothetical protein